MIGVNRSFKSHVARSKNRIAEEFSWYIYTPQREHLWAEDWETAMAIANQHAREAQIEALR